MSLRLRKNLRQIYGLWGSLLVGVTLNVCFGAIVHAVPVDFGAGRVPALPQAQIFYSPFVSRIADEAQQGCMVSVGTDWKESGQVRYATEMEAFLSRGQSLDTAFTRSSAVDIGRLSSNTPYMAFVKPSNEPMFLRIVVGFQIETDSFSLTLMDETFSAVTEPRGDSVLISDEAEVARLFEAFTAGSMFAVSARSRKLGDGAVEHYLRYAFDGRTVEDDFERCVADLDAEDLHLNAAIAPRFALTPQKEGNVRARIEARAMACNRELDPEGTEILLINDVQTGPILPIGHALLARDSEGAIADIWSGDLWRISRTSNGYALAFSNSISAQTPFQAQSRKACTRFGNAICVDLTELEDGSLSVEPCFDAGIVSEEFLGDVNTSEVFPAAATLSNLARRGVTPVSNAAALSQVARASTVSRIVAGVPEEDPNDPDNPDQSLTLIPLPATFIFGISVLFVLIIVVGMRNSTRRSQQGPI